MVDESRSVSFQSSVDYQVVVDAEHVATADAATATHRFILLLALVGQYRADDFAGVLYHHIAYKQVIISSE